MINTAEVREIEAGVSILTRSGTGEQVLARLRERIDFLLPDDRLLVELILSGTVSRARAAALLNLPPWRVTRRLRTVSARLHDPLVAALMEPRCPLAPDYRQIGVEHFLTGLSAGKLAAKHSMRPGEVRRMIQFIKGWHRGFLWRERA